jgi:class 3 adenylate cyclase
MKRRFRPSGGSSKRQARKTAGPKRREGLTPVPPIPARRRELRERTDQVEAQSQELAKLNRQLEERVIHQVGEIERMSRLRRFLPPQVADLIVASGTEKQLESHRREITALFCDLRGFRVHRKRRRGRRGMARL